MMHIVLVGQHLFAMDSFDGKYVDGKKFVNVLEGSKRVPVAGTESTAAVLLSLWLLAFL